MNFAIIAAAGKGARMGKSPNKVLFQLLDYPIIYHTIKSFHDCGLINEIVVVAQKEDTKKISKIKDDYGFYKIKNIVHGGKERQDSVYNGLMSLKNAKDDDLVIVQNGCSPLVRQSEIAECLNAAWLYGAAAVGFELKDTIKKARNGFVERTIDRNGIFQMQTPQAAKYGLLVKAYRNAISKKIKATDDTSLIEAIGRKVKIVPCSCENMKITTQDDLRIAEGILMKRRGASCSFRVGFGHDSHKFSNKPKPLVLGGVIVPYKAGLEANSDGDVIFHALFNAVSSAIGEKSIGNYADKMYKNGVTDSSEYLRVILSKLSQKRFVIANVSISIEAVKPKLDEHTDSIKSSLSRILGVDMVDIGITCTSGEGMSAFGQGKGIQCFAVVTLTDKQKF